MGLFMSGCAEETPEQGEDTTASPNPDVTQDTQDDGNITTDAESDATESDDTGVGTDASTTEEDATTTADADATVEADADATVEPDADEDTAQPPDGVTEGFDTGSVDLLSGMLDGWQVLHPERAISIDVGTTKSGWLVVVPVEMSENAWFEDRYGPLVYRDVTGSFSAVTHLRVVDKAAPDQPPSKGFNAGGFVVRDASGTHSGDENWVMYNMGGQGGPNVSYGREIKKTLGSNSDLFVNPQVELESYLKVCRVGDAFTFYAWSDGAWREEQYHNAASVGGDTVTTFAPAGTEITPELSVPASGQSVTLGFTHASLPDTLQVGVMGHTWSGTPNTRAEFDYVHITPVDTTQACLDAFPEPTAL